MDRRFLTVLGLSLVLALVVSLVFYQMVASRGPERPAASATKDVVVATRALSIGATIKAEDVKLAKFPVDHLPKGAFSKVEEVLDRPVTNNVLADEPVVEGRLAARGSGVGLAPVIPVGMRAVAVRVSDVAGVSGFVLPGLKVDVLVTGTPPDSHEVVTRTCLQNIQVLSAGTTMQPDAKGQAIQTPTVTLLVNPEQAETLTLAGNQGNIQLVLRNSSDKELAQPPSTALSALYHGRPQPQPKPEPGPRSAPVTRPKPAVVAAAPSVPVRTTPPPPPEAGPEVIVIRGIQKTVEAVPVKAN